MLTISYASEKPSVWEAALVLVKILFRVTLLLAASELAKRSTFLGAIVIALPPTFMLAMTWLYLDTRDADKVAVFARDIFFLVQLRCCFPAFPAAAGEPLAVLV
ncbi:MAG TPA: hypothetical protein VLL03_07145 [Burkholderiales bacterium]|nr:hypothetical protein [Burkholderiales bacterium]